MLSQLRWAHHVARMPDHRLPKRLFYRKPQQEVRFHGGQKKRFRDTLKTSTTVFYIKLDTWEQTTMSVLDGATLSTKAPIHVKKGQLQHNKRDRQGKPEPAIRRRSPTLPSKLSPHIPCTHHPFDQPSAYPQIVSPPQPPK